MRTTARAADRVRSQVMIPSEGCLLPTGPGRVCRGGHSFTSGVIRRIAIASFLRKTWGVRDALDVVNRVHFLERSRDSVCAISIHVLGVKTHRL